ncbi:MAG: hypothetical protein R3E86_18810 [Pseudomonadales bacterium]
MTNSATPDETTIRALVGHEFPGGTYTIAHWENFLLTECTGAAPMPGDLAHPVALFHVPILGAGTSIAEMFALGRAESDFSIGIESYDWELHKPLHEELPYHISGRVTAAERRQTDARTYDRIQFQFDLHEPDGSHAARSTITWRYGRSAP